MGSNVTINSAPSKNPTGGGNKTHLNARGGKIKIGNNVGISRAAITARTSVTIEDDVLIGTNCMITDTDFHSLEYDYRMERPDTHVKSAPVLIKEGVWLGARVIVLKGVTIGKHSIVGAGSVVTKNIPDGEIWAGNPARFIRRIE